MNITNLVKDEYGYYSGQIAEGNWVIPGMLNSFVQINPGCVAITISFANVGTDAEIVALLVASMISQGYACRLTQSNTFQVIDPSLTYLNGYTEFFLSTGHLNLQFGFNQNGVNIFINNYIDYPGITYFDVNYIRTLPIVPTVDYSVLQFGAGNFPSGVGTSAQYFFDLLNTTPNSTMDIMPRVTTGDYQFDSGGLVMAKMPTTEQVLLLVKTSLGSASTGYGLRLPPVLNQAYKVIVAQAIERCLQPLIDSAIIRDFKVLNVSKKGSQVSVSVSFKDLKTGTVINTKVGF